MAAQDDVTHAQLSEAYAQALRLRTDGLTAAEIADRLGLEREAGESLLRLADAKLARVQRSPRLRPPLDDPQQPPPDG